MIWVGDEDDATGADLASRVDFDLLLSQIEALNEVCIAHTYFCVIPTQVATEDLNLEPFPSLSPIPT